MRLWRLSSLRRARDFDGGYGLSNAGRWNTQGRPVTYCSTVPSLAALEKRVHVTDPSLLPPQIMVEYDVPDDLPTRILALSDLPVDWTVRETLTQNIGDEWLDGGAETLLLVPSVIVPLANAPERNVLINHRHAARSRIKIVAATPFTLEPRLFQP
ncbi:MAG: RES family NAD+ phosphorylase [Rhizobiales bacterium]|nr:RES family NAD+ phosphorylase [Hyphomicrobiales bacterium]